MNKRLILLSVLLFGFAHPKLVKTKVSDNIMVSLPASLTTMTQDDIVQRYPSVRAPLAAYTNEYRTADFSVNTSASNGLMVILNWRRNFLKRESATSTTALILLQKACM
jgi:hypothetical protein